MKVYVEIQEMVWNKYRVYGVESEQELKELLEKKVKIIYGVLMMKFK